MVATDSADIEVMFGAWGGGVLEINCLALILGLHKTRVLYADNLRINAARLKALAVRGDCLRCGLTSLGAWAWMMALLWGRAGIIPSYMHVEWVAESAEGGESPRLKPRDIYITALGDISRWGSDSRRVLVLSPNALGIVCAT